jgi:hypothetical protein
MSGGHFEYIQYRIDEAANDVRRVIADCGKEDQFGYGVDYSDDTKAKFAECELMLRKSAIFLQRVDWLVSGDDGEESFHRRLEEDLKELQNE